MPKPNCENLSNSASAKPSYFFLFFFSCFLFFFSQESRIYGFLHLKRVRSAFRKGSKENG